MPMPEMTVLAEGTPPAGPRWVLKAGGDSEDLYTFVEAVYPDGHRDEGGMGGPPLPRGSLMNAYAGGSERGTRRVLVRASPRVARVRVHLGDGEHLDLFPVAARPDLGLVFFATLVPPSAVLASVAAMDEDGQVLESRDLSGAEAGWRHFLRRVGHPEA